MRQLKTRLSFDHLGSSAWFVVVSNHSHKHSRFVMKRALVIAICALMAGVSSFAVQHSAARPVELSDIVSNYQKLPAEFVLLDAPRKFATTPGWHSAISIKSAVISGTAYSFSARGETSGADQLPKLVVGARYTCVLNFRPAPLGSRFGFNSRCQETPKLLEQAAPVPKFIQAIREAFIENTTGISKDARGLVAGIAIGDTSLISEDLISQMKTVSLTHLTAVSGANCAIVLALVYLLIRKLGGGRWFKLLGGLAALVAYVNLVGSQPSVLRAAVMATAVLISVSLGRSSSPANALALSIIVLLIADPWLAVDYGFALSVSATLGLLLLTKPITEKLNQHFPFWLSVSIAVAISAQVFCLPVLLQLQSGLSTYALPANLLAAPLVAPITVLGILGVIFAIPFPWLTQVLTYLAALGAELIGQIAISLSKAPMTSINWPVGLLGITCAVLVIAGFLLWLKSGRTILRNLGLATLVFVISIALGGFGFMQLQRLQWPIKSWQVVACDVGQGDALVVKSEGKTALIDVGKYDEKIDNCLSELGIQQIDMLVLTHFDLDHVGGIKGALKNRKVGVAIVSPFKDERWGATGTSMVLAEAGIKIQTADLGTNGKLGELTWRVLSPMPKAAGAEDSNDASLVILFKAKQFNLLTMADIGEQGQMRMTSNSSWWKDPSLHEVPLILKVSHHGSADQYPELIEALKPDLSLISVGADNSYGHPTQRTLKLLVDSGAAIARTDLLGSIAVGLNRSGLVISNSAHG